MKNPKEKFLRAKVHISSSGISNDFKAEFRIRPPGFHYMEFITSYYLYCVEFDKSVGVDEVSMIRSRSMIVG